MTIVRFVFTCCYCFAFVTGTGDYRAYVTSNSRFSTDRYSSSNPSEFKSRTESKGDLNYDILKNEIQHNCKDLFTCVQLKMLVNVSDILRADLYNLAENVVLERVPGSDVGNGISKVDLEKLKDPDNGGFQNVSALLVEKTLQIFKSHALKWNLLPGMDVRIFRNLKFGGRMDFALETQNREPRTFGGPRKRLAMLILPLMYKMGVMTTMLGGLVLLTLKGLTIGVILLILAVGNLFSKHKHHAQAHHAPTDIHVHIHNDPHGQAYSGWHQEHVEQPTYHVEQPGHYHRRWSPPPQQPVPLPYTDLL